MDYYLVSTPLHLYIACALALERKQESTAHLIFIDQYPQQPDMFLNALNSWENSPFVKTNIFFGRDAKGIGKLRTRKKIFLRLREMIAEDCPQNIFVGNDRRVEFQYAMHYCRKINLQTKGIYFDEGLFTYIGREASERFSERVIDNVVRKLFYGLWWQSPKTIGTSKWIEEIYVAFPKFIHPLLKSKIVRPLESIFFSHKDLYVFAQKLLSNIDIENSTLQVKIILTLPEATDMKRISNYQESIHFLIESLLEKNFSIAVKYHPSATGRDLLRISKKYSVQLIPDHIPFEILLPLLNSSVILIGDMSSTLLTTKMLRPDIKIIGFEANKSNYYLKFKGFFESLDIGFYNLKIINEIVLK
jgi:hypothetical protein